MKYKSLRPLIRTLQLEETIQFYTQILGFELEAKNEEWGWASLISDDIELMIALPNAHEPFEKPHFTGSFYINIENVEDLWLQIKDQVKVCYELEVFDWGMKEFAVYDNNGYLLQFGEEV